jgi:hypothetical protein
LGLQFAENLQANWQEGYCFIKTMPDTTEPEKPRGEFRNCSGNFLNIRLTTRTSDFRLFGPLENHLGGKCFANDKEVETDVGKWLLQQSKDF